MTTTNEKLLHSVISYLRTRKVLLTDIKSKNSIETAIQQICESLNFPYKLSFAKGEFDLQFVLDSALKTSNNLKPLNTQDFETTKDIEYEEYVLQAKTLKENNEIDASISLCDVAIQIEPNRLEAQILLAENYISKKMFKEADNLIEGINKMLETNSENKISKNQKLTKPILQIYGQIISKLEYQKRVKKRGLEPKLSNFIDKDILQQKHEQSSEESREEKINKFLSNPNAINDVLQNPQFQQIAGSMMKNPEMVQGFMNSFLSENRMPSLNENPLNENNKTEQTDQDKNNNQQEMAIKINKLAEEDEDVKELLEIIKTNPMKLIEIYKTDETKKEKIKMIAEKLGISFPFV